MKKYLGPLCFVAVCFLIAFRDVLSDRLLTCEGCSIHPTFLALIWSVECAILAWLVRSIRERSFGFVKPFLQLKRQQQLDFLKLGVATWIVYIVTVYGIRALSSPVFNLIDYGSMPMLTLWTAARINRERITIHQSIGAVFSVSGIFILMFALGGTDAPLNNWPLWLAFAFLSPLFTSVCSSLQSRQVKQDMAPDEVLLYRFPIPAVLTVIWFCFVKLTETPADPVNVNFHYLPAILFIGAMTVFLPLWLLCYAFVRSSVGQLASYLFLIAVFTFALAPLLVKRTWDPTRFPQVLVSAMLLLIGYVIAEGLLKRPKRSGGEGGSGGEEGELA